MVAGMGTRVVGTYRRGTVVAEAQCCGTCQCLDDHVQLFASDDEGHSWQDRGPPTPIHNPIRFYFSCARSVIDRAGAGSSNRRLAIVQQAILDRWNPHRLTKKICDTFGLSVNQVRHIRSKATFKAEYARQLAIYQGSFEEVQLGHRKERVKAMDDLYHLIPQDRTVEHLVKGAMAGTVELAANLEHRRDNLQVQRAQV